MRLVIDSAPPSPQADPALVKAIARARRWFGDLANGTVPSLAALAEREKLHPRSITQILPLAFLAPDIVKAAIAGRLPRGLGLTRLADPPMDWTAQRRQIGI